MEDGAHSLGLRCLRGAVSRNLARARQRRLWAPEASNVADDGPIRAEDGEIFHGPPDDELIPQVLKEELLAHSNFPFLDSEWDESTDAQRADSSGYSFTLKRTGIATGCPIAPAPAGFGRRRTAKGRPSICREIQFSCFGPGHHDHNCRQVYCSRGASPYPRLAGLQCAVAHGKFEGTFIRSLMAPAGTPESFDRRTTNIRGRPC